ncbi:MAG: LysR family transcriptional regulator [Crocinitomicaceae bacterium]|nr:LysR family transcriptional regulator [Crocinitomicaceae bacterium]
MLSFAQVQYILSLIEFQHFQRAADACFVTQPTLSMQIKKAEELMGSAIFDRDKNPIELSPFGRKILPHVLEINSAYQALSDELDKSKGVHNFNIRLAVIPTIAAYLIPDMFKIWQSSMPNVELEVIELKTSELLEAIEMRKIDIGILAGPIVSSNVKSQILYYEPLHIYSGDFPNESISVDELINAKPWLLSEGNCLRTQMMDFCNLKESKNNWNYTGGNLPVIINMVNQEGGYTILPKHYMPHLMLNGAYVKCIEGYHPARQVVGLYPTRTSKIKLIQSLLQSIQQYYPMPENINQLDVLPWKN